MTDKLSWTPLLRGKVFCSPACGCKCTKEAHDKAQRAAAALVARLGDVWEPHVWENSGWNYEVRTQCGRWHVYGSRGISGNDYMAGLNIENSGGMLWYAHASTPEAAIRACWKKALPALKAYLNTLDQMEPSLVLPSPPAKKPKKKAK
jgi:hypothetical protein